MQLNPRSRVPAATASREWGRLGDLRQAEQLSVEVARGGFLTGRHGDLDVINADQEHGCTS
jgi:hypothetical protein